MVAAAVLLDALVVGAWALTRGVNADEGFYLSAGRDVAAGARIYTDFFFPQMPYLPWLEGLLFRVVEPSLIAGRAVSVAAAALSAGVVAWVAWRRQPHLGSALFAVFLYVASALLIASLSVVKTASASNLCLLIAFAALAFAGDRPRWALAAGVAMGCGVGFRGPLLPLGILFAVLAWRSGSRSLAAYSAGAVVASLPWLFVLARDPEHFWFGNFGFHALRREISGAAAILGQKRSILAKWFFLPQHVVIWALALCGLRCNWRWSAWPLAGALLLAATYAAATPTYLEYMAQFYPLLLLAALPALPAVIARPWFAALLAVIYLVGLRPLVAQPPAGSPMAAERDLWSLATVRQVIRVVDEQSAPGDSVLSWWEGYPVLSGRPGFRGVGFWESNAARKLDADTAHRYRLMRRDDIQAAIRGAEPAVIIVPDGTWESLRPDIEAGYTLAKRVESLAIYRRSAPAAPAS